MNKPLAAQGLQALGAVREELRRRAQAQQEAEAAARLASAQAAAQREQFAQAVGPVRALRHAPRAEHQLPKPAPQPVQRQADERAALVQTWSDEVDVDSLLLTDDGLSYRHERVSPEVLNRLRRGQWAIQAELDLHGLRRDEAREALRQFLRRARQSEQRCVRIVHGKGHGSPGREPVLKVRVQRWLAQAEQVLAFTQASGPQGGAGALIVLLGGR